MIMIAALIGRNDERMVYNPAVTRYALTLFAVKCLLVMAWYVLWLLILLQVMVWTAEWLQSIGFEGINHCKDLGCCTCL